MFDRLPDAAPADTSAQRLCAAYDSLFATPGAVLSGADAAELTAMAGIYDLDTDRSHAEVWTDLRAVLTKQVPREDGASPAEAIEPLTILVVEDDPETAADLTEVLTDAGHSVVGPFQLAEAAEAAAAVHAIDIALLDINLSGETDGATLAQSLKDRWGIPILFLSGDVTAAARHAALAEVMVLKPYSGRDVLAALEHFQASRNRTRG